MASSRVSVVVISRNEGKDLRRTVENLEDTLPGSSDIVVVDDGSTDRSTEFLSTRRKRIRLLRGKDMGVAKSRMAGAAKSRGDVIVFADAHIEVERDWWKPLVEPLDNPRTGAVAPTITNLPATKMRGYGLTFRGPAMEVNWRKRKPKGPSHVPIVPGCCVAMRREVVEEECGGWDAGLLQRGNVDNEFSVRLWLLGYELLVVPEVLVRHRFRPRSPFPVGWAQYIHNRLRLAFVHFKPGRLEKVISGLRAYPAFGEALGLLIEGDITARRRQVALRRTRDDDWFCERFGFHW